MKSIQSFFFKCFPFLTFLSFSLYASYNDQTLEAYEKNLQSYIEKTPQIVSGSFKEWLDRVLYYIAIDASILEIGSAFGRDADYIELKGYSVQRSDATQSFLDYLHEQGCEACKLNILTDPLVDHYDVIFANAVLLHFTPTEFNHILEKIYQALHPQGIFAFSVKRGYGYGWSDKKLSDARYFCYWQVPELSNVLINNNFKIVEVDQDDLWIRIITCK